MTFHKPVTQNECINDFSQTSQTELLLRIVRMSFPCAQQTGVMSFTEENIEHKIGPSGTP